MSKIRDQHGRVSVEEFISDYYKAQAKRKNPFLKGRKPKRRARQGGDAESLGSFKFLECDPISIDAGEDPEPCPVCEPDPAAYVPDYLYMAPGEVFFDARDCRYCVVLDVAPPNMGGPNPNQLDNNAGIINDIKKKGIKKLLEHYNKSNVATVFYYVEEPMTGDSTSVSSEKATLATGALTGAAIGAIATGGAILGGVVGATVGLVLASMAPDDVTGYNLVAEERNVTEELLYYTDFKYMVPPQTKARTKLLVRVDAEVFTRAPTNAISDPSTMFETTYEVSISGADFKKMFDVVPRQLRKNQKEFARWQSFDGGQLLKVSDQGPIFLDLDHEAELLERFEEHFYALMEESGFHVHWPYDVTRILENITFKFEPLDSGDYPRIRLKQVVVNKFGCPEIVYDEENQETRTQFKNFIKKEGMSQSTTLYYVGALPEMYYASTAQESMPWLDFILAFTYPGLQVSPTTTALQNLDPGACFAQTLEPALAGLALSAFGDVMSFADVFMDELSENLCYTKEQLEENHDKIVEKYKLGDAAKKALSEAKKDITKGDNYMEIIWEELLSKENWAYGKPGSQGLDLIYSKINDRLGYCGWIAVIIKALDCVAKGLGAADFKAAMVEAAMTSMSDVALQRVFIGLPREEQDRIAAAIADDFKGLPAPWDTASYKPGSYSGSSFAEVPNPADWSAKMDSKLTTKDGQTYWDAQWKLYDALQELGDMQGTVETTGAGTESGAVTIQDPYDSSLIVSEEFGITIDLEPYDVSDTPMYLGEFVEADAPPDSIGWPQDDTGDYIEYPGKYWKSYSEELHGDDVSFEDYLALTYDALYNNYLLTVSNLEKVNAELFPGTTTVAEFSQGVLFSIRRDEDGNFFMIGHETTEGGGGTYGEALAASQREVVNAYLDAALKVTGVDVLIDSIKRLPGASWTMQYLQNLPCKPTPLLAFDPRWDSWMNTLKFDFCHIPEGEWFDATLPWPFGGSVAVGGKDGNLFKQIQEAAFEAMMKIITKILMDTIKSILELLFGAACELLALGGASLLDLYDGSDKFRNLLTDNLCPGESEDLLNEALSDLFSAVGGPDASCLQELGGAAMGEFIDDLSLMLTQNQICELLKGKAGPTTISLASEVARTSNSSCIREVFSDIASIRKMFSSLGRLMPINDICADLTPELSELPASACTPDMLAEIDDLRCKLLSKKGLNPEQCRNEIDKLKEASMSAALNLGKSLNDGLLADMPPLVSTKCEEGIYAQSHPLEEQVNAAVSGLILSPIESNVIKDLLGYTNQITGNGGFFNNIMSDTQGRTWKTHDFMVKFFGSPLARQNGYFEWASDDAIQDPDRGFLDPEPIDIYGNELKGEEGTGASFFGTSTGGYPPTVASWLAQHYRNISSNMQFKTITIPDGFPSMQAAVETVAEREAINAEKIESRSKYIEQYIQANFLDHKDSNDEEFQVAGILRRTIYSDNLFHAAGLGKVPGSMSVEEKITRAALLGEDVNCCAEINDWDATDSVKITWRGRPNAWSAMEQKNAGTDGENWGLWAERYYKGKGDDHGARLYNIPDISTSDLQLVYNNYEPTAAGEMLPELEAELADAEMALVNAEDLSTAEAAKAGAATGALLGGVAGAAIGASTAALATEADLALAQKRHRDAEKELNNALRQIEIEGESVRSYIIGYDYNLFDEEGLLRKDNDYKIRISVREGFSPNGGGKTQRNARRHEQTDGGAPDSILDEAGYEYYIHDFEVNSPISDDIQEVLNSLPLPKNIDDSWQIETFYRIMGQEILEKSATPEKAAGMLDGDGIREYFAGSGFEASVYDQISSGFVKRISNRIATGRSYPEPNTSLEENVYSGFLAPDVPESTGEELDEQELVLEYMSPAFKYGHDPYEEPEIIYLDNETYGGTLGKLFPDKVPPPFYVKPPPYGGWLDIVERLLPTPNSCDPKSSPFFSLSDIKDSTASLSSELKEDPRLEYDPYCTQEAPYDKIYQNITLANLEAVLRSTARLYITNACLTSIPIISQFAMSEENFDEGVFEFIVENMKTGLVYDGSQDRLGLGGTNEDYYYQFLEQVVNNIARKVQSGILDLNKDFNEEERSAFETIGNRVMNWYPKHEGKLEALSTTAIMRQSIVRKALSTSAQESVAGLGAGSTDFSKSSALEAKRNALLEEVGQTEEQALVLLKRMVREEYLKMSGAINGRLLPPIQNIDHLFLLSDTWIRGGLNPDGPLDVVSDPFNANAYNIPSGQPSTLTSAMEQLSSVKGFSEQLESAFSDSGDWPFVLQKYIRIIEKDEPTGATSRADNLYDIVNIEDWDSYIQRFEMDGDISDFWGEYELSGETTFADDHSHDYDVDEEGNGMLVEVCEEDGLCHSHEVKNWIVVEESEHTHELSRPAWRFGLRICYMPPADSKDIFKDPINTIDDNTVMREKAFRLAQPTSSGKTNTVHLIPICSAELDIPDQSLSDFDPQSYDVYCLIQELIKTPKYQTWFRYVFPLQRYLTTLTIYSMMTFVDSVGNTGYPEAGGDLWENKGGNSSKDFRKWDQVLLRRARNKARDAFESLYDTTQDDYEIPNESDPTSPAAWLRSLKPLVNFEDGLRWWQRGRRIKSNPFDDDGNIC